MNVLRSRTNPRVRRWQRLARDGRARRAQGRALIEGPHLVDACLASGGTVEELIVSQSGVARREIGDLIDRAGAPLVVLSDAAFRAIVDAETPQGIAAEIGIPSVLPSLATSRGCVMLDGVQDAGNVGADAETDIDHSLRTMVSGRGHDCCDHIGDMDIVANDRTISQTRFAVSSSRPSVAAPAKNSSA